MYRKKSPVMDMDDELEDLFGSSDESNKDCDMANSNVKNPISDHGDAKETVEEIAAICEKSLVELVQQSKSHDDQINDTLEQLMEEERVIMELQLKITLARKLVKLNANFNDGKLESFWMAHVEASKLLMAGVIVEGKDDESGK